MVIVKLEGGLGNQFGQYVNARLLAYKLNTELKFDMVWFNGLSPELSKRSHVSYRLGAFNIVENFATPEEIKHVKEKGMSVKSPLPNLDNFKGDIYMYGQWPRNEKGFLDILDIIRKEFTLKESFHTKAESWKHKILSAECSVAMHFRHGDFAYNPWLISNDIHKRAWFNITPLDYYYTCMDILKQRYDNLTVFVFSDNMPWVKENLCLDVPTEFIEGVETDNEEFILMSLCKHMIYPNSTFSEAAVVLNTNPDKKIFRALPTTAEEDKKFLTSLTPAKKNSLLDIKGYIWIPFNYYNQPEITQQPIFSLLLVVNDDVANLPSNLENLLRQDYKYYEVIIIDNASTDGSDKICQETIKDKVNVTYKRLDNKVSNAAAWNEAFRVAQGKYVLFLKVGDRFFKTEQGENVPFFKYNDIFLTNSLAMLYCVNEYIQADIIHMFSWLEESASGDIAFAGKKFSAKRDAKFQKAKKPVIISKDGINAAQLMLNRQINSFLGTKIYNREFLTEHKIKFDEELDDTAAEEFFQIETFFKSKYFMYISNALYVASL